MSVTKTTRFQVLKRDEHTCQYCGAAAPDVKLTVDHVIPVALGGSDKPDNLVAACVDCNAGKGSSNPDSDLVERLSAEAATYALAMSNKVATIVQRLADERAYASRFYDYWCANVSVGPLCIDEDWKSSTRRWQKQGIPIELIEHCIDVTVEKASRSGLLLENQFRYMAGVLYTTLKQEDVSYTLGDRKVRLYTEDEFEEYGATEWLSARDSTKKRQVYTDLLARHIDKQANVGGYADYDFLCARFEVAA